MKNKKFISILVLVIYLIIMVQPIFAGEKLKPMEIETWTDEYYLIEVKDYFENLDLLTNNYENLINLADITEDEFIVIVEEYDYDYKYLITHDFITFNDFNDLKSITKDKVTLIFYREPVRSLSDGHWDSVLFEDERMIDYMRPPLVVTNTSVNESEIAEEIIEELVNVEKYYDLSKEFYSSYLESDGKWILDDKAYVDMNLEGENELVEWFEFADDYNYEIPSTKLWYPDFNLHLTIYRENNVLLTDSIAVSGGQTIDYNDTRLHVDEIYKETISISEVESSEEKTVEDNNELNVNKTEESTVVNTVETNVEVYEGNDNILSVEIIIEDTNNIEVELTAETTNDITIESTDKNIVEQSVEYEVDIAVDNTKEIDDTESVVKVDLLDNNIENITNKIPEKEDNIKSDSLLEYQDKSDSGQDLDDTNSIEDEEKAKYITVYYILFFIVFIALIAMLLYLIFIFRK